MSKAFDINGVQLKVGDTITRIRDISGDLPVGTICKVTRVSQQSVQLEGCHGWYSGKNFDLVEQEPEPEYDYPNGKHPYHDVIVAWAKGAVIQTVGVGGEWVDYPGGRWSPSFNTSQKYRIKPKESKENKALQAAKKQLADAEAAVQAAQEAVQALSKEVD